MNKDFPEQPLMGRSLLAYNWIEGKVRRLLDAGCSYGYSTQYFRQKADEVYGIDLNPLHIQIASMRYPDIHFACRPIEDTGFDDEFFDYIVFTDVLEHTNDKIKSLSELHRILKPGGLLILSTPHAGMFEYFDPYNYGYFLKRSFPFIYNPLFRFIKNLKNQPDAEPNPEHDVRHWHYSEEELIKMLEYSDFKENFRIEKVFKSGLFMEVLAMNAESLSNIGLPDGFRRKIVEPLHRAAMEDYGKEYGGLSYNIAMKIRKK